jgi:hypothetical protein
MAAVLRSLGKQSLVDYNDIRIDDFDHVRNPTFQKVAAGEGWDDDYFS